jgi:hypothetical protein
MAFNNSSGEHVRAVAHPHILILLVMGRPSVQRLLIAHTVDLISVLRKTVRHTNPQAWVGSHDNLDGAPRGR